MNASSNVWVRNVRVRTGLADRGRWLRPRADASATHQAHPRAVRAGQGERRRSQARQSWPGTLPPAGDPRWLVLLDADGVETVVLDRREDASLLRLLRWSGRWTIDCADGRSVILVRAAE